MSLLDQKLETMPVGIPKYLFGVASDDTPCLMAPREVLAADRTYYVRTDGSDSNNGLANTSGGAFATIQKALDIAATLDFGGKTVTIQLADGTYSNAFAIPYIGSQKAAANLVIQGNPTTPKNVVVRNAGGFQPVISAAGGARVRCKDFQITASAANGYGLQADSNGVIEFSGIDFGANLFLGMTAQTGGVIKVVGNYTISAGGFAHISSEGTGAVIGNGVCTISNTPAFTSAFAYATSGGYIRGDGLTYSGSATGVRYKAEVNAVIDTKAGGASWFPGNSAGTTATGGQYA